jgi:lysophospholipase L1-like esterase
MIHTRVRLHLLCCVLLLAVPLGTASAKDDDRSKSWVTAWGTSQQPNVTPQVISNATIRMIARVTVPGETIRIRLDNTFGASAVTIGKATVGWRVQGARLAAGSSQAITFGNSPTVVIPVGGSVTSDLISLRVLAQQDLGVSLFIPQANVSPSMHQGAVVTSYRSADNTGDVTSDETPTPFTATTTQMWWLKSIEVLSSKSTGAVVAFGDSITDGTCSTLDANDRWENWASVRLDLEEGESNGQGDHRGNSGDLKAMVNEGIGGNTVTRDNLQPPPDSIPGIERFDRDVLSHSGVTHVVLFMGTNDIRREASAAQVIAGMENIIQRAKDHGLKIIGVTIIPRHNVPPSGTNTGWNPAKTAIRNEVNQWIRTSGRFDAVIDFDKVVRDPAQHDLLYPAFNCGDGIHPSPRGYYEMGKSVDLDLFEDKH